MSKSPGHRKWPDHQVREKRLDQALRAEVAGQVVAESSRVIEVDEDEHPSRYYFPRSDVRMELLERSPTTTECPFKGTARHFTLKVGDREVEDAAWSYEEPYEEHAALRERIAFYADKVPDLEVRPAGSRASRSTSPAAVPTP